MRRRRTKRGKARKTGEAKVAPFRDRDGQAVINRQRGVKLAMAPLEKFWRVVRDGLGLAETELVICFVTDAEMARMNWAFRKKRGPTDVLSFPVENFQMKRNAGLHARRSLVAARAKRRNAGQAGTLQGSRQADARPLQSQTAPGYLGDIAISPATARQYAQKNGRSLTAELRVLMLHGVLHLLGYDHEADSGEMNRLEAKLRRRFGLA
jgi:rRNA maturation RNase YbeY